MRENRIPIMMSDDELKAVDDWRYSHRCPTRSRAIRYLCNLALTLESHNEADRRDWLESIRTASAQKQPEPAETDMNETGAKAA